MVKYSTSVLIDGFLCTDAAIDTLDWLGRHTFEFRLFFVLLLLLVDFCNIVSEECAVAIS